MKNHRLTASASLLLAVFVIAAFATVAHADGCINGVSGQLCNPLNSQFSSIPNFIAGVLKVLVMVALPIITLFFVVAGFKFISAQGNEERLGQAKKNFVYVILGAILILGAWVIATLIGGTVSQLTG